MITVGECDFKRDVHCVLGLPFDAVDMAGAVRRVRSAASGRKPCFLSTPNLNFLIGCRTDASFRNSVINSDLSVADGMPLIWIARILRIPITERVAGSDLFQQLQAGQAASLSVYFFGGPEGAAAEACRRLNATASALRCVGWDAPGFGSLDEISGDAALGKINDSGADFLVVALGAKKGQAWIEKNRAKISVPVISHLGAVVNFTACTVKRAPVAMQRTGLEWVWRISQEPALWRRYFSDGMALLGLMYERVLPYAIYIRLHPVRQSELDTARVDTFENGNMTVISCVNAWTLQNIDRLRPAFSEASSRSADIELRLGMTTHVDSAFVAMLMLLYKKQMKSGRQLYLSGVSKNVRKILFWNCAEFLCSDPLARAD